LTKARALRLINELMIHKKKEFRLKKCNFNQSILNIVYNN